MFVIPPSEELKLDALFGRYGLVDPRESSGELERASTI
jgi:hypothetical protein